MTERRKVSIRMSSHQNDKNGREEDNIDFFTTGEYYQENDIHVINYEESELSGLEGTKTTLRVKSDSVVLEREGNFCMCQTFRVRQKEYTTYKTPYGELLVEILPTHVKSDWGPEGGTIDLQYLISVDGQELGEHQMYINVEQMNDEERFVK